MIGKKLLSFICISLIVMFFSSAIVLRAQETIQSTWEYRVIPFESDTEEFLKTLKKEGLKGWELVDCYADKIKSEEWKHMSNRYTIKYPVVNECILKKQL